jgi:hypothetical protein
MEASRDLGGVHVITIHRAKQFDWRYHPSQECSFQLGAMAIIICLAG